MKQLIKKTFKTIFNSKIFSIILMIIIVISSLTYTLLQSSTNSFKDSYSALTVRGNLHDLIVKELYTNKGTFDLVETQEEILQDDDIQHQTKVIFQVENAKDDYQTFFANNSRKFIEFFPANPSKEDISKKKNELKEKIEKMVQDEKPTAFKSAIEKIYSQELSIKRTETLSVITAKNGFKFVNAKQPSNSQQSINNIVKYGGSLKFSNQLSDEDFLTALTEKIKSADQDNDLGHFSINKLKGYKWIAQNIIASYEVVDPSSFQAIISPSYANLNHKQPINPDTVLKLYQQHNYFQDLHSNHELLRQYERNIITVDQTPYFIIGIGASPDFAFPIIDQTRPIPVPNDEAIVYTNQRGFERIFDGFRNNAQENYFSLKFFANVGLERQAKIMQEIDEIARNGKEAKNIVNHSILSNIDYLPIMSWPQNIKIVTPYDDPTEQIILVPQRIIFLKSLQHTIHVLTITTTSFLLIFVSAIILLIFKSLLSLGRSKNATLMALGYSKTQIAFSMALITGLIISLPSIIGYVIGHILQYPFINIFAEYWTIPTYGSEFSIVSLMITVIIPLVLSVLMIFALTYSDLNAKVPDMISGKSKYKFSLTKWLLKPLTWTTVKVKYIASLTINNAGRLILSSLAGIIALSAIIVGLSSIGKAEYAYNQTIQVTKYSYQTNLSSPTNEGGEYELLDYEAAIKLIDSIDTPKNSNHSQTPPIQWHVPSVNDLAGSDSDIIISGESYEFAQTFLKHKLQFKPLIDVNILGINAWNIAKKLMPENQRNMAELNEQTFYKLASQATTNQKFNNPDKYNWWPQEKYDWKIDPSTKIESSDSETLKPDFIKFVQQGLEELRVTNSDFIPYIISYNLVLYNQAEDETYTYMNTDLNQNNYNILGIKSSTKHFNLPDRIKTQLNDFESKKSVDNSFLPLIINQFMAEKHHLKTNDILQLPVNNHAFRKQKPNQKLIQAFKIIDILDTYDNDRLLTSQQGLNQILNLSSPSNSFNGIFTSSKTPLLLGTLPLYSEINLYLGTDTITGRWRDVLENIFSTWKTNGHPMQSKIEHLSNHDELISLYSKTPYVAMFVKVLAQDISNSTFDNISSLSSSIIWIIQIISIVLSILFAIIVSSLLISANHKKIATLWTLGYTKSEIMRMFSLIYLLPIIISIGFGIPIALGVLAALRLFVINFGSILIPFALTWWAVLLALIFIGTIFVLTTVVSVIKIKNKEAISVLQGS